MGVVALQPPVVGLATGDPTVAMPGSGLSGPPGLEATIEYNGVYFNIRNWIDTYLITNIDGLADADVRDAREVNPAQHGETYFDAYYGGRTIVISGKIRAHNIRKLRDMQQALRQVFNDLSTERALIFHGADATKDMLIYCKKSQTIAMAEVQQGFEWSREFQVTLRASNPRFLSATLQSFNPALNWYDDFQIDTIGSGVYTFDTGAGSIGVTAGKLAPTNLINKTFYRNNLGIRAANYRDTIKITPDATLTSVNTRTGIVVKRLDGNNFIYAQINHDTNGPKLEIVKADGGAHSLLGPQSAATPALVNGTGFWFRAFISGDTITAEFWATDPILGGAASTTLSYTLLAADKTKFGVGIFGDTGLRLLPPSTGWRYDELRTEIISLAGLNVGSVMNSGNFPAQPQIILGGPITNPVVIFYASQSPAVEIGRVTINGTIPAGDVWTLDIAKRKFTNQVGVNKFATLDATSGWPELQPAQTFVELDGTAMDYRTSFLLTYRHTWV